MSFLSRFSKNSLLAPGEKVSEQQLVEEAKLLSFERSVARSINRRNFLASAAVAGAAATTVGLAGCSNNGTVQTTSTVPSSGPSVVDVLNFALNLEYLEASFYLYVTTGAGLPAADMGTSPGTVSGGAQIAFTIPTVMALAQQLATDEREHVEFLRSTITQVGGTPVSMPNINLAAMGAASSDQSFVMLARQLETVGVSAYAGAAQYLVTNTAAVTYSAQILDTEAQHEGFLREFCILNNIVSPAVDAQDIPPTATAIFNTSPTTGFNPIRTTSQVLGIVYGKPGITGVAAGGFFPNGLNGTIATS